LSIKFLKNDSACFKSCSNELVEKAALWDTLCFLSKPDSQWLLPFFWSKETKGPSAFAYALALVYESFGGSVALRGALGSTAVLSAANALRNSQELGGHPVQERTLFAILRLANRTAYEDVLRDEKESAVFELYDYKSIVSNEERKRAVDRAKQRVRRAKNLLTKAGVKVNYLDPQFKTFRKLLLEAEQKLSRNRN
jgi:hypothetical protein